jgi:hypothetical protein
VFVFFVGNSGRGKEEFYIYTTLLSNVRTFIFYGCFVLGHIFFILSIIKGFSRKGTVETVIEEPGFLDEFYESK